MKQRNRFLLQIGRIARKERERFWDTHNYSVRLSNRHGQTEAGLWFRTQGCRYDHQGGCIMCDYSTGPATTSSEMIQYVQEGLNAISEPCQHLLVSPSGSMLDEWEVPLSAREGIFKLMRNSEHKTFSFETRADTITEEAIKQCNDLLGDRLLKIYIGLESANSWISKYCINKDLSQDSIWNAIQVLKETNIKIAANILLGTPFLSIEEDIENMVKSILWAIEQGADECYLFPTHVKKATPLFWLYRKDLYSPPSLWSLVEVLNRIGSRIAQKHIKLSWYTSYGAFNVVASPTTCESCYERVISLLDRFDETGDFTAVQELVRMECACKETWRSQVQQVPSQPLPDRVVDGYKFLAKELLPNKWWESNQEAILTELHSDANDNCVND